jgi:hypothetical protein
MSHPKTVSAALVLSLLVPASVLMAEDGSAGSDSSVSSDSASPPHLTRTWTASLQAGYSNTFQMTLGGTFGDGPDFQNRASVALNNAFRAGDTLQFFGWSTTDAPTSVHDWQAGLTYKAIAFHRKRHTLALGGGVQRWILPNVKSGAQDWLISGALTYNTTAGKVPIVVTQDSWSLLRSTLPSGSAVYTQVYSQHTLLKRENFRLLLRQGPAHTYSWGMYGAQGNRVFRYGATVVLAWKNSTTLEGGFRQQFGLQDGIHYNRYYSLLLTRQFTGKFHKI